MRITTPAHAHVCVCAQACTLDAYIGSLFVDLSGIIDGDEPANAAVCRTQCLRIFMGGRARGEGGVAAGPRANRVFLAFQPSQVETPPRVLGRNVYFWRLVLSGLGFQVEIRKYPSVAERGVGAFLFRGKIPISLPLEYGYDSYKLPKTKIYFPGTRLEKNPLVLVFCTKIF